MFASRVFECSLRECLSGRAGGFERQPHRGLAPPGSSSSSVVHARTQRNAPDRKPPLLLRNNNNDNNNNNNHKRPFQPHFKSPAVLTEAVCALRNLAKDCKFDGNLRDEIALGLGTTTGVKNLLRAPRLLVLLCLR